MIKHSSRSSLRVRSRVLKAYLIDSSAGLFLLEKTGKISEKALFAHNPSDAASQLKKVLNGELPPESSAFGQRLTQIELDQVTVDSEPLARLARPIVKAEVVHDDNDHTISKLRNRLPSIPVVISIIDSKDEHE